MFRSLLRIVSAGVILAAASPLALADELTSVYSRILVDPTNSELNLQYALIAEGRHEYRKALAAYERVLVNDPGNAEAREGLQRVRRIIQPPLTQKTFEAGARWQSNVLRSPVDSPDILGYGSFRAKDERVVGGYRWRTNVNLYGELYGATSSLNYGALNGDIGPIVDMPGTLWSVRPAVGAGTAYANGSVYYYDTNASALFEGYLNGAYQWLRVRAGYRQYDPSFGSRSGAYVDATAKYSLQDVFHEGDVVSIAPWLRWSGIVGDSDRIATDFATGLYTEAGATLEYAKVVNERLNATLDVKVSDRIYRNIGSGSRQDWLVSPGGSLTFKNLFGPQTDLRLDYHYEWNNSNDPAHDWQNHVAGVAVVVRR